MAWKRQEPSVAVKWSSQRHPPVFSSWPLSCIQQGLTWLSKVKTTHRKSSPVISKGIIIQKQKEGGSWTSTTARSLWIYYRQNATQKGLERGGRGKDRQAPTIMCLQHVPSVWWFTERWAEINAQKYNTHTWNKYTHRAGLASMCLYLLHIVRQGLGC